MSRLSDSLTQAPKSGFGSLSNFLGFQLNAAKSLVFDSFGEALSEHGLSARLFGMLAVIDATPGINQTDLSSLMEIDRSQTVRSLDELEAKGLVRRLRDDNDRRVQTLFTEKKGAALLSDLEKKVRAHEQIAAKKLNTSEQKKLLTLLRKLNDS